VTKIPYWLVVPAAGSGRRFAVDGSPKQYWQVAGRSLIEWACSVFVGDPRCIGAVFAIAPGDAYWPAIRQRLANAGLSRIVTAEGGAERADSVRKALRAIAALAAADALVLVHDAARPCLSRGDLDALLAAASQCADGALLAAPLADTLKRGEGVHVAQTIPREQLWRALTPQAARYARLCAALDAAAAAGRQPTDESQALEWCGAKPRLVPGAAANLKVTTQDDLQLAKVLLETRAHANLPAGADGAG
jgi:2-C-methyl-D-erythritol 4-phosphate cytidylyltransferase